MTRGLYLRRLAGALPAPKRIFPESRVAASAKRTTRGALPAPKRTRLASAIFLDGLRTTRFLLDMWSLRKLIEKRSPDSAASGQDACAACASSTPQGCGRMKDFPCSGALV